MIVVGREGCHGPEYQKDAKYVGRAFTLGLNISVTKVMGQ
jgi:hypothetical protein